MPLPTPRKGEKQADFVSRCISAVHDADPERPNSQAVAICYSQWRGKEARSADFERIHGDFLKFFPSEGESLYHDFLAQNGLDETKPYTVKDQMRESFEWIEPKLEFWKQVKDAKYYKAYLKAMSISMNKNDYTNRKHFEYAGSNLGWRALDVDHSDDMVLPFPENRLESGQIGTNNVIEAVIRVSDSAVAPDTGESVQELIEKGEIVHPSIMAYPICGTHKENGVNVPTCGYEIERVALLRKSRELPGDPLSRVFPLPLNESLSKKLVENLGFSGDPKQKPEKEEKMKMTENTEQEAFGDASFPDGCFAYVPDSAKGENGNKSDRKLPYKNADGSVSIDHVRNALARLDQTDGIPAGEKERIRTMLQNILKKDNPDYQPPESLDKDAEIAKLEAELAAEKKSRADDNEFKSAEIKKLTREGIALKENLVKTERVNAENTSLKAQLAEGANKRAELETEGKEKDVLIEKLNETIKAKNEHAATQEDTIKTLTREKDLIGEKLKTVSLDLKQAKISEATAKEEARQEMLARAKAEEEKANVLDDNVAITKKYSNIAEQRAKDAKIIKQSTEENAQLKEKIEDQNAKYEKARKWMFRIASYLKTEYKDDVSEGLQVFKD
jgi:hypothetical protein